ncbi:Fanconi anemia group M isoform X1, partial [Brachionus plicatilis]
KIKNKFIMEEAVLSGEDSEDDEDEDDYDLKDSFVDTKELSCDESMYLKYQKSLRDAERNRPSYLTRKLPPVTDDIFSQMPTQDSWYAYDSFCVPDDQVSFNEKKSRKKKSAKFGNKIHRKQEGFRRIKNLDMTCVNDEAGPSYQTKIPEEKKIPMTQLPRRKKLVNDDSDDDIIAEEILVKPEPKAYSNSLMIIDEEEEDFKSFKSRNDKSNLRPNIDCIYIDDDIKPITKSEPINPIEVVQINEDEDEEFNNWINDTFAKESAVNNDFCFLPNQSAETSAYFSKPEKADNKQFMSHFNQKNQNSHLKQEVPRENNKKVDIQNLSIIPSDLPKNSNWIIVDASLLTSAADIVKNIRRIWQQEKVVIQSGIGCDFIISQRNAVLRFKWSELSAASMRDQIIDRYAKCKSLYNNVIIIVIDDRENNKNRSKLFDSVIANLAKCSQILYSKSKTEEFSYELYYLSNFEKELGFHLDLDCNRLLEKKKKDFLFYHSLPNLSIINSLYLCKNFDNISKFCTSSLEELKSKGKMNDRKARKLLRFLIDS